MVTKITRAGLIVSTIVRSTDSLDELVSYCDWPVLISANARRIQQQFELARPECLLFWLEERNDVAPTAKLVARLRERGPRPFRVVMACRLPDDVEPVFRAAGVHGYFSVTEGVGAVVEQALWPWLEVQRVPVFATVAESLDPTSTTGGTAHVPGFPALVRPP